MELKPTLLMTSLTKKLKPKTKNFVFIDVKTCQIFWGFEQLSNTIVSGDIPAQKHVQTARF